MWVAHSVDQAVPARSVIFPESSEIHFSFQYSHQKWNLPLFISKLRLSSALCVLGACTGVQRQL